jgi:putative aldouronate transport system substrate-binding protein
MKKTIAWLLLGSLLAACLAGCGTTAESSTPQSEPETAEAVSTPEPEETAAPTPEPEAASAQESAEESAQEPETTGAVIQVPTDTTSYPLTDEDITLTYFNREYPLATSYLQDGDWNNHVLIQEAEKITGVKIDYIAVPAMSTGERYSLSFASGDLADMYYWGVNQYTGGADGAVADDIFIPLNDLIDEYAPNYKAARESSEDIMRQTISDEGNIVSFYVLNTENVYSGMGFMTRQDLLDQAGLDIPVTYDDWYEMLTAYKNMGVQTPSYSIGDMGGLFFGGFGFEYNWIDFMNVPYYQVDGQVQFSPFADNFRLMLETCNKWYTEGLVLEDFYSMHDMSDTQAKEYTGETALWTAYANAVNVFANNTTIPGGKSVAIPNPVLTEGDQIHISTSATLVGNDCGAVSTSCAYPELAVQWLDFWYGDQGYMLVNYGVEDSTFVYDQDGKPQLTELITNNPYGLTTEAIQALYLGYNLAGLFDPTVMLATYDDNQLTAMDVWTSNMDDAWNYPSGAAMTSQETTQYNTYYSDISTYLATEVVGFVTGSRSMDTFDDFIATLKSMGADECIALKQQALDRYYSKSLN